MLHHWHLETPEQPLLLAWLFTCLTERYGAPPADRALLSWTEPAGTVCYRTLGRDGIQTAASWEELARAVPADRRVVVQATGEGRGTLSTGDREHLPTRPGAVWSWTPPLSTPQAEEVHLPAKLLYPVLPGEPRGPDWDPKRITLVVGGPDWSGWQLAPELAARLRDDGVALELEVVPADPHELLAPRGLTPDAPGTEGELAAPPTFPGGSAAIVVFCSGAMDWSPWVLAALAAGRYVLAPRGAAYAGYLEGARGGVWDPEAGLEALWATLNSLQRDPSQRETVTRRAAAWARRWTVGRMAVELEQLALSAAGPPASPRQAPDEWVLRREIGIGDVVFGLCAAAGLKRRDPECRITFHTAPEHQEWVRCFPCVDAVTSGRFAPPAGARVVDWEANFPSTSPLDRATAMGQLAGVDATWPPPPDLPQAWLEQTAPLLRQSGRLRIAFAPASKGRHVSRSFSSEVAAQLARLLQELGEVVWLDAEPPLGSAPEGITDLSGRLTLPEVVGVLAQCDLCVSVDSGLLFLAAALGKPVVGLFSHIGALQRLWLAPRFVALQPSLPCAPCGEGPEAFSCQAGRRFAEGVPLPCVQMPWHQHLPDAVQRLLASPSPSLREVWNLSPTGERLTWNVDALPAPWLRSDRPLPVLHR